MDKKIINFVVTDLDDTIWDWLNMWHSSFNPYLQRIAKDFSLDINELKNSFKQLHQNYGTTEASFIVEDLSILTPEQKEKIFKGSTAQRSIMHEYNSNKKNNLATYSGVVETLMQIKSAGTLIVGFTESHSYYTKYRLKTLNLDGLFDCIYAPIDKGLPVSFRKFYPDEYWEPQKTEFRYLSKTVKKPNAEILEIILKDFNAPKDVSIYIGDKLDRDISMAQTAGITSVYAEYGHQITGVKYELLREVTHWTDEDVEREKKFKQDYTNKNIQANYVLKESFKELDTYFQFTCFEKKDRKEDLKTVVETWKKVVDVQQHFNDIELRIRNYALTLFTGVIAAVALLEKDKIFLKLFGHSIPASAILSFTGLIILLAFYYMDRFWYHRLLVGAVKQGLDIEARNKNQLPELGLTTAIGKASPHRFLWLFKVRSDHKFQIFYGLLFVPLLILTITLFIGHHVAPTPLPVHTSSVKDSIPLAQPSRPKTSIPKSAVGTDSIQH